MKNEKKINVPTVEDDIGVAEMAALGAAVLNPVKILGLMADWGVKPEWFDDTMAQDLFKLLFGMFSAGEPIDILIAEERMRMVRGNKGALAVENAVEAVTTAEYGEYYLGIVRDKWFNRSARTSALDMCDALNKGETNRKVIVAETLNSLASLLEFSGREKEKTPVQIRDAVVKKWEDAADGKISALGAPWPIAEIGVLTCGMVPGLHIVAARPSVGKTVAEGCTRRRLLRDGYRVISVCLDMSPEEAFARDICAIAGESMGKMKQGHMTASDRTKIRMTVAAMKTWSTREHIITSRNSKEIIAKMRAVVSKYGAEKLVVTVDYIQLIDNDSEERIILNDNSRVARVSSRFKGFALSLGVPTVVLAQLNRGTEKEDRIPQLSDLRDSGAIEQDASSVSFLYPCAKVCKNWMEPKGLSDFKQLEVRPIIWDLLKNQNGPTGRAGIRHYGKYFKFEPADLFGIGDSGPMDSDFGCDFKHPRPPWENDPDCNRYVICRHPKGAVEMFEKPWFDLINSAAPKAERYEAISESIGVDKSVAEMEAVRAEMKSERDRAERAEREASAPKVAQQEKWL